MVRAGGGADARDRAPAVACGWELAGLAFPRSKWGAVWPGRELVARVIHLCGLCGSAEGMVVRAAEGAGLEAARPICVRVCKCYQLDLGC